MIRNRQLKRSSVTDVGFTLIELIVSVTLIALIALCLWGVLRISISSWKRGTESMDANQKRRATVDLVQKQMASISGMIPSLDLQTGAGQSPIFLGTDNAVQFVSLNSLRFRENPGLTVVTYEIVPQNEGEYALVERESRYLGGDPTLTVDYEAAGEPVTTIFDHLVGAGFEYFDPGNSEIPAQWVKDWNAQEKATLPSAISITLSTRGENGQIQNRQVVVPIMAEPDVAQSGFIDPFEGRRGGPGAIGPPGGRGRDNAGPPGVQPFGGRRGGSDFGPPGGRRGGPGGGPGPGGPPFGGRRGGRF